MYQSLTATLMRIYNLSSGLTAKTLRELLNSALAGKSAPANTLPTGGILQVTITPSADVIVSDAITGDGYTIPAGTRVTYPTQNAIDTITLLNSATVTIELYFDQGASK